MNFAPSLSGTRGLDPSFCAGTTISTCGIFDVLIPSRMTISCAAPFYVQHYVFTKNLMLIGATFKINQK